MTKEKKTKSHGYAFKSSLKSRLGQRLATKKYGQATTSRSSNRGPRLVRELKDLMGDATVKSTSTSTNEERMLRGRTKTERRPTGSRKSRRVASSTSTKARGMPSTTLNPKPKRGYSGGDETDIKRSKVDTQMPIPSSDSTDCENFRLGVGDGTANNCEGTLGIKKQPFPTDLGRKNFSNLGESVTTSYQPDSLVLRGVRQCGEINRKEVIVIFSDDDDTAQIEDRIENLHATVRAVKEDGNQNKINIDGSKSANTTSQKDYASTVVNDIQATSSQPNLPPNLTLDSCCGISYEKQKSSESNKSPYPFDNLGHNKEACQAGDRAVVSVSLTDHFEDVPGEITQSNLAVSPLTNVDVTDGKTPPALLADDSVSHFVGAVSKGYAIEVHNERRDETEKASDNAGNCVASTVNGEEDVTSAGPSHFDVSVKRTGKSSPKRNKKKSKKGAKNKKAERAPKEQPRMRTARWRFVPPPNIIITRRKAQATEKQIACSSSKDNRQLITGSKQQLFDVPESAHRKRKQEEEKALLSDWRLDRYACALWCSDNRRRIQQQHELRLDESAARGTRGDGHQPLEDILRQTWEKLGDSDKIRYFQRAKSVMVDRDFRRGAASTSLKPGPSESATSLVSVTPQTANRLTYSEFLQFNSQQMDAVIGVRLRRLSARLPLDQYECFVTFLNHCLTMVGNRAPSSNGAKDDITVRGVPIDIARKVLFEAIVKTEQKLGELERIIVFAKRRQLMREYDNLIARLISELPTPASSPAFSASPSPRLRGLPLETELNSQNQRITGQFGSTVAPGPSHELNCCQCAPEGHIKGYDHFNQVMHRVCNSNQAANNQHGNVAGPSTSRQAMPQMWPQEHKCDTFSCGGVGRTAGVRPGDNSLSVSTKMNSHRWGGCSVQLREMLSLLEDNMDDQNIPHDTFDNVLKDISLTGHVDILPEEYTDADCLDPAYKTLFGGTSEVTPDMACSQLSLQTSQHMSMDEYLRNLTTAVLPGEEQFHPVPQESWVPCGIQSFNNDLHLFDDLSAEHVLDHRPVETHALPSIVQTGSSLRGSSSSTTINAESALGLAVGKDLWMIPDPSNKDNYHKILVSSLSLNTSQFLPCTDVENILRNIENEHILPEHDLILDECAAFLPVGFMDDDSMVHGPTTFLNDLLIQSNFAEQLEFLSSG